MEHYFFFVARKLQNSLYKQKTKIAVLIATCDIVSGDEWFMSKLGLEREWPMLIRKLLLGVLGVSVITECGFCSMNDDENGGCFRDWKSYVEVSPEEEKKLEKRRQQSQLSASIDMQQLIKEFDVEIASSREKAESVLSSIKLKLISFPDTSSYVCEKIIQLKKSALTGSDFSGETVSAAELQVQMLEEALRYACIKIPEAQLLPEKRYGFDKFISFETTGSSIGELKEWSDLILMTPAEIENFFEKAHVERDSPNPHIYPDVVVLSDGRVIGFRGRSICGKELVTLAESAILQLKRGEAKISGSGRYFHSISLPSGESVLLLLKNSNY